MTLATGSSLGGYEILAPLGAGGMGEVYRARDSRLGREVAIKVLPHDVAADPERLARFEREARTVAALNHPSIVTLHAIEDAGGTRFLVMERVEGRTLDALVAPGGLPLARVLELAIPLADALAAAHAHGVVHRDLKPANVMVTPEGRIKVLDFGLARNLAGEVAPDSTQAPTRVSPVSTAGTVVGTVPYMAPEQLRGEPADERSDLFACGVILYELLAGRRPFGGATSAEISSAILRDAPVPLATLRGGLPHAIGRTVARLLEKDPARRIASARELAAELEVVRRGLEPATASSPARAAAREAPSIAVLPFASRSRDEEDEYFAEGLADELLNVLAKVRGLRVAARSSSSQFKGRPEPPAEIGRKLNVAALLEGSVRKSGNRVRIAVQLVAVEDGFQLWSETYDRTLDDIFAVQDDIAQSVVKELRSALLGDLADSKASGEAKADVAAAAAGRGTNAEAHRLFLLGRHFLERASGADVVRSIDLLERALALDPRHAQAWAALSWAHTFSGITGHSALEPSIARGREAVERALDLAPELAEAHMAMGALQQWYEFDFPGADASLRRAIAAAPGSPDVIRIAGILALMLGRFEEALELANTSVALDPLSPVGYGVLGRVQRAMGRSAEAAESFARAIELSPLATSMRSLRAFELQRLGRSAEALEEAGREQANWSRLYALAVIHHLQGRAAESGAALAALAEQEGHEAACQVGIAHAVRGEIDTALEWLERARAQHDSGLAFSRVEPLLAPLRGHPRFEGLMRSIGLAG